MPVLTQSPADEEMKAAAYQLVKESVEAEPEIIKTYWFPSPKDRRIRLIHVDTIAGPTDHIRPFYFSEDTQSGLHFPSGVALILPENDQNGENPLDPPAEWGTWHDAIVIYDAANAK